MTLDGSTRIADEWGMSDQRPGSGTDLLGFIFIFGFGAVFALAGLTTLYLVVGRPDTVNSGDPGVGAIVGGIFALIGFGIMLAAVKMRSLTARKKAAQAKHPEEPWLWRPDWAERRIRSTQGRTALFLWIFALFWNLISWSVAPLALRDAPDEPAAYIVLIFPLVGLGLLTAAAVVSLRMRRYGESIFVPTSLPAVIGGEFRGRIVVSRTIEPERDLRLKLSCVRVVTRGSGKNSSTHEDVLFANSETIAVGDLVQDGHQTEIPVRFTIPWGWPPSDDSNPRNRVVWRIDAEAEMVGIDYRVRFEIPAFVTADSNRQLAEVPKRPIDLETADRLGRPFENSKIGLRRLEDGAVELDFPAGRNPGMMMVLGVIAIVWGAIVVLLAQSDAPLIFPLVFGLFEALIVLAFLHALFSASIVHLRPDGVGYEKRVLGFIRRGWHERAEIAGLSVDVGSQSGNKSWHRLRLDLRSGKKVVLGDGIAERDEAVALEATAEEVLGLRKESGRTEPVRE